MGGAANPRDDPADADALARHAAALIDAAGPAIETWVRRSVADAMRRSDTPFDDDARVRTDAAARAARDEGIERLRKLLETDVDEQRTSPLEIIRSLVRHPTEVVRQLGAAPIDRDEFERQTFPDDDYGFTPASLAAVDHTLQEPGLVWGAAKAHVVLARRRREGRR